MLEKSHVATAVSFHRRSHRMDEATKAGIGATLCSVVVLAVISLSIHMLPGSVGHAAIPARSVSLH